MFRFIISVSAIALAGACTTTELEPIDPSIFVEATPIEDDADYPVEIVETVTALALPGQMKPIDDGAAGKSAAAPSPSETIAQGRQGALIEPSVDGYVNAIQVYPYTEGALFRLYASPGQVSDIALQPGETLVSVSAGDTVRWVVGDTQSGSGQNARAHVLVKPISAGIRTNLMIATDRRTYHLELESVNGGYMAALSWRYPADELARLTANNGRSIAREAQSIERGLELDAINFDYRISGDTPAWKPVRVFDDGRQVYIQMPKTIAATDMPPLFVLGASGDAELVNYRVRGKYYVVDQLFRAAELRLGSKNQTVVRITRVERRRALSGLFGSAPR